MKIGIEELHFQMLKFYSPRYEILVPIESEIRGIEYYDKKSKIVKNGKEFKRNYYNVGDILLDNNATFFCICSVYSRR